MALRPEVLLLRSNGKTVLALRIRSGFGHPEQESVHPREGHTTYFVQQQHNARNAAFERY